MSSKNSNFTAFYSLKSALLLIFLITVYRFFVLYTSDLNLYGDEAYYWGWAQNFAFGYYSKPPVVAWIIMMSTALFGDGEIAIKIGSLFFYMFTSLALYLIGRELFNEKTGFFSMLAFTTLPAISLSTMIISTDVPFLLFWSLSLFMFIKAIRTNQAIFWILLGITGGLGLLSKYTMLVFMVSALIYLALSTPYKHHLKNSKLYLAMGVAALVYLPNLLWNINNHFASFLHTKDNADLESTLFHPEHMIEFLASQLAVFGPIFFIMLLIILFKYKEINKNENFKLLTWFVIPFFTMITGLSFLSGANANWSAPMYIASTLLVVAYMIHKNKMKLLIAAIGINIAMGLIAYHSHAIARVFDIQLTKNTDVQRRVLGWDVLGEHYTKLQQSYPGAKLMSDDRKAMALLIYYAKPHPFDGVFWNPDGSILNHYELTTDMNDHIGENFIFLTHRKEIKAIESKFEAVTKLDKIHIPIHQDYSLDFDAYYLENFKGY